jgi:hypothetical protein
MNVSKGTALPVAVVTLDGSKSPQDCKYHGCILLNSKFTTRE